MKKNRLSVIDYIKDAFLNERKKDVQSKFLLAPYHEGNHWVLIVLDLVLGLAYVFDSATPPPPGTQKLEGFNCIQMAYRIYWTNLENDKRKIKSQKLRFIQMKGYVQREMPYSDEELEETREQWAKYFKDNYLMDAGE
ncbi:uncharacterized protein [Spinacia oleracea]|uniref:Uncharacterized protein isoform X2 n=1 Tax=Spinacia oleracea TaxID=3562 RepID=A0ABM3QGH4_SPIOL|nr:uncharacterized protein LOC130459246 isoform X2 [Spinacia oleracea]